MDPTAIPGVPESHVTYVDDYGNLKTTIENGTQRIEPGTAVRVRIGEGQLSAKASDGSFGVEEGELAFAPGSSGWRDARGEETV